MSFTVIVGQAASKSHRVLIAHNEDVPGRTVPTQRFLPASTLTRSALAADIISDSKAPCSVFCADILGMRNRVMSSMYLNDQGVMVFGGAPVSSFSAEDKESADKKEGVDAELLQVASQADSAEQALDWAAKMIHRYGYSGTGRNVVFADAHNAWIMSVARGCCWAARRIADDEVFMFTDAFAIRAIDLKDPSIKHSGNLPELAAHYGMQTLDESGRLDFALAFQNEKFIHSCVNEARIQQAFIQLTGLYHEAPCSQLLNQAGRNIGRCDLQRVLRASSLQTVQERACGQCDAMHIGAADIAGSGTRRSWVMRFHDRALLSVLWLLQGNPESGVYLPWFALSGVIARGYERPEIGEKATAQTSVFAFDLNRSYYIYAMIGELCNFNRGLLAGILRMQKRYEQMVPARVMGVLQEVQTMDDQAAASTLGAFTVAECETMDRVYDSLLNAIDRRTMAVQAAQLSRSSSDEVEVVLFGSPEFNVQGIDLDSVAWSVGFDTHPKAPLQAARALAIRFEDVDGDGMVDAVLTFSMEDVAKFAPEGVLVDTYLRGLCDFLRFVAMDPVVFTR